MYYSLFLPKTLFMKLIFATHNHNKFREVELLMPRHIQLLSLNDIGCTEDIPETGSTIAENALLKARYVAEKYRYPCFSDDTGLEADALEGAPGIYTARYAGKQANAEANMQKLLSALQHTGNRKACFKTVIAIIAEGKEFLFEGVIHGKITKEKRGEKGFGYDPVFQPEGYTQTFAELPLSIKNKISHRAKAITQLVDYLR